MSEIEIFVKVFWMIKNTAELLGLWS